MAGRAVVAIAALGLIGAVVVTAERSRQDPAPLKQALGIGAADTALVRAADAVALRGTVPNAAEIAIAREVAVAEPLSALPFYLFGAGGQARDPAAAIEAALQRDPRLRPAYRWQAVARARGGDVGGATRALIRLGVLSPTDQTIWPAIAQLTADPVARRVIKAEIARGAPWRDGYLATLSASTVDRAIVFEMLQTARKQGAAPPAPALPGQPNDRAAFIAAMVARKDYDRAYLAWVEWLPAKSQAAVGHVFDSDFKGLPALPPFAWQLTDGVGGSAVIDPASGLMLDYSGTDGTVLARQTVLLAPGRYQLATDARFDAVSNDDGAPPLAWTLTCLTDSRVVGGLAVPLDGTARKAASAPFVVDASCPAQQLALQVNSVDFAKRLSGQIRSVSIRAVTQ